MEAGAGIQGQSGRRWLRPSVIVLALSVVMLIGAGTGLAIRVLGGHTSTAPAVVQARFGMHGEASWAAGTRPAPMIDTLRDQFGKPFSLASLRGRNVAVVFFDSHCTTSCPLEGRALSAAERALPRSQRPALVVVSVNTQDTPKSTAVAVRKWGLSGVAPWYWLMGTRRQLAPVWANYHIYVSPHLINGDIEHTEALYLVDRRGNERTAYLWPFASRFVTTDLRTLAARPKT
jgi:cytochrome oxidase Cu insertion factor (SCO1/SenC/PrrC family)